MKKTTFKLLAAVLALSLLLSGCGLLRLPVSFDRMVYTRPDVSAMQQKLDDVENILPEAKSAKQIMDKFYLFYFDYLDFVTNYSLAYIHYCQDMTDIYWEQEYNYCLENTTWLEAGYDQLLYALADTPLVEELESANYFGPGFFDAYEGDSLWDDTLVSLTEQEDALLAKYYTLSAEPYDGSNTYMETTGLQIAQVYTEMIALRQQIAEHAGYPDYPSFAYDFYHRRDYTPKQAELYMASIQKQLVPLYKETAPLEHWAAGYEESTPEATLQHVAGVAGAMGGVIKEAFDVMKRYNVYDITPSEKKYDASFEIYLYSYNLPFVFVNSNGTLRDRLTLTHEFGHFCRDYASYGFSVGVDVLEFFSQGLENLSLFYTDDRSTLEKLRLQDSLNVYVEQAAYASFEQQVYQLTGDDLTVENVDSLYTQVMKDFGLDMWGVEGRDYVLLPHIFISPMYIISYIVSNDAALQLYQLENAKAGDGLAAYQQCLSTQQSSFLAFIQESGLESPFQPNRLAKVRDTFADALLTD